MLTAAGIVLVVVLFLLWRSRPRRPKEPGFPYVYINQDGSVRELSPEEQAYLGKDFAGGDGGRPYIKSCYESRDGWGSRSGFLARRRVPVPCAILPVHPDFDTAVKAVDEEDLLAPHRAIGDLITLNEDGSTTCTPNPALSRKERFELLRELHLEKERRREALAKV